MQSDKSDKFNQEFQSLQQEIESNLDKIKNNECESAKVLFDQTLEQFNKLKEKLDLEGTDLPQYVKRTSQERINNLLQSINDAKNLLKPKKTFKFNTKLQAKPKKDEQQTATDKPDAQIDQANEDMAICGLKNRTNEQLKLEQEDVNGKDVQLRNLDGCEVNMYGNASTVHIINCKNCKIQIGPVSTSIFIDKCVQSTLQLFCQQLRVHNTYDTVFYLHVTTKGIIEDSSNLKFGRYEFTYDNLENDILNSKLNRSINNWNKIEDFNWLVTNKQSPNWSLI